jgi:cell division protein FtsW
MLNMAVNVHLVPVTGLTLPMISMGGSSIWFTSIAIGIVLSVSKYVDEEVTATRKKGTTEIKPRGTDSTKKKIKEERPATVAAV